LDNAVGTIKISDNPEWYGSNSKAGCQQQRDQVGLKKTNPKKKIFALESLTDWLV
jgi:hypothetical protein